MNLDRLIGLEHYLNAETIKAYYEEGIITAPVAIKLYLVGAMRRSYWERKTTMAKKLGIPYATVKRACKKLKAEGFAFQDRFESRCEDHGETKYLRLWHLGPATVSGSGKGPEVNLLDTDRKGPEVNLPTDKKGPKVNLLGVTSGPLQGSKGTESEPYTREYSFEKKSETRTPIARIPEKPEKSGAIGTIGVITPFKNSEPEQKKEFLNRGPDVLPVNVPPIAQPAPSAQPANPEPIVTASPAIKHTDKRISENGIQKYYTAQTNESITAAMRAQQYYQPWHSLTESDNPGPNAHIVNLAHDFNDILTAIGFHGWEHDEAKDIATAWSIYESIHPSWRNKADILSLLLVDTRYILSRARKGAFVPGDLWLNSFKDRMGDNWKVMSKEKPEEWKWDDWVAESVRFLLKPPQQA